jgi:aspartyl-tRNA(Asn)/glutamyl-tRNA(Gln) amidotransferase subunit A
MIVAGMTATDGCLGRVTRRRFLEGAAALALIASEPGLLRRRAAAGDRLTGMTLRQASEALRDGRVSSVDLARACLDRIDRLQGPLNAFITVAREPALEQARQMDEDRRNRRWRGPLHGVPLALKDNIDTAGIRTSCASALFVDRVPDEDADVTRRLKQAGAVILGKLNMDEFGLGGNSVVTYFKPVRNPWMPDRSAGGSSGGSAAAVAAELCFGALGTDSTGSLRIPATFCGVVGFKPTYGRVSPRGVVPLSWTFDHVGPVARTVEDAALILQVIAGHDPQDPTTLDVPVPDYVTAMKAPVTGLRLGIPRVQFYDAVDAEVAAAVEEALAVLRRIAPQVRDMRLPPLVTVPSVAAEEMYAYHADTFAKTPWLYQPPTRRRLDAFAKLTAGDYILGRREIDRLRRDIRKVFEQVDVLVMPTVKIQPRTIEEAIKRAESERPLPPELGNTGDFNMLGLPAISVPCGFTKSGLPIGLQIVGPHFGEGHVLALAHAYERATAWHTRRPRLAGDAESR